MSNVLKSLNATSEMLVRASGTIDKRIAAHLVNIAKHINGAGNGDVSAANYFFSLLTSTSGVRKDAIGNWLMTYAGCSWNADKKQFGRKKGFVFDLEAATKEPWYVLTPQKEFKPFNLEAALASLIKKAHKALEDEEHASEHKVNKSVLNTLEMLASGTPLAPSIQNATLSATPTAGWDKVEGGSGPNGHEEVLELTPVVSKAA